MWRFVISDQRLDEKDPFFYHKTTRRQFYDREMERQKALTQCDEVVFLNKKGELTEGTRTNLFIEIDGRLFTPALTCGLLPGTLREELLDLPRAAASEAILTPQDLMSADRVYLGNSVRGLVRAELIQPGREEETAAREHAHAAALVSVRKPTRHGRACPGHPRLFSWPNSWMPGTAAGHDSVGIMSARGDPRSWRGQARSAVSLRLGLQPAGGLAERGAQLDPGAGQTFADILGALAQRLGLFPHLPRGLGGAGARVAEGAFGLAAERCGAPARARPLAPA